jgi:hypothetical protein
VDGKRSFYLKWEGAKYLLNMAAQREAKHVRRSRNKAAHSVAQFALNCNVEQSWYLECPTCIQDIILVEQELI